MTATFNFASNDEPILPYGPVKPVYAFPEKGARTLVLGTGSAILVLVVLGVGLGKLVLDRGVSTGRQMEITLAGPAETPVERYIAIKEADSEPGARSVFPVFKPRVDYTQTFSALSTHPPDLCQAFADAGYNVSPWQRSQWDPSTWECVYETPVRDDDTSVAPDLASGIFFVFRGTSENRITSLRIKLSLLPGGSNQAVLSDTRRFFDVLDAFKDLYMPRSVADAVVDLEPILMSTLLGSYRFGPERGDPHRFNLVVSYQPSDTRILETAAGALTRSRTPNAKIAR